MTTRPLAALTLLLLAACSSIPAPTSDGLPATAPAAGTFRVAVVQLNASQVGDFAAMEQFVQQATSYGAQLVIFPESSVLGWLNPNVFYSAQPIPGYATSQFAAIAQRNNVWIAAGLAEQGQYIAPGVNQAWDSGILVNPLGQLVVHHRKYQVLQNAFATCPTSYPNCQYTQAPVSDIVVVDTPFGRTSVLVCADAYTWDTAALDYLKTLDPQVVIIPWGVGASTQSECGQPDFNATTYAAQAAAYLKSAYVIGANAQGTRPYGRFLPAVYCGNSGYANPDGTVGWVASSTQQLGIFDVPLPN